MVGRGYGKLIRSKNGRPSNNAGNRRRQRNLVTLGEFEESTGTIYLTGKGLHCIDIVDWSQGYFEV